MKKAELRAENDQLSAQNLRLVNELKEMRAKWRPVPITHEWQPRDGRCALCDDTRDAARHQVDKPERRMGNMKIYVVMVNDRHTDPEPFVFATAEAAITYARSAARDYAYSQDDIQEKPVDGWLYRATYSVEGDSVWVIEKELDTPTSAS